jgi:hypothetical protein
MTYYDSLIWPGKTDDKLLFRNGAITHSTHFDQRQVGLLCHYLCRDLSSGSAYPLERISSLNNI